MRTLQALRVALALMWSSASIAQPPVWLWATALRGAGYVDTHRIAESTLNGCYVSGSFATSLHLPWGDFDNSNGVGQYFIAHLDSLGQLLWAKRLTHPATTLTALGDGGVMGAIAYTSNATIDGQELSAIPDANSIAIFRIDEPGASVALTNLPALIQPMQSAWTLAIEPDAGVALLVQYEDSASIAGQWVYTEGLALARIDAQCGLLWAQRIGNGLALEGSLDLHGDGHTATIVMGAPPILPSDTIISDFSGTLLSYGPDGTFEWRQLDLLYDAWAPPMLDRSQDLGVRVGVTAETNAQSGNGTALGFSSYSGSGAEEWQRWTTTPTQWGHQVRAIRALPDGSTFAGGYTVGSLQFGSGFGTSGWGPSVFVALLNTNGNWQWVVNQTSGNVFAPHAAPGTNSRIYVSGYSDTQTSFGGHALQQIGGAFYGIVACLGDVTLSSPDHPAARHDVAWPNPASDRLTLQLRAAAPIHILDAQGRTALQAQGAAGLNMIDLRELSPGPYAIASGQLVTRFIKE